MAKARASSDQISYTFELLTGASPSVRIELRVRGESDGSSRLAIAPGWGGVQNCERFVHDLTVQDVSGRELSVVSDSAAHGWDVACEPSTELIVSYYLRAAEVDPLSDFSTKYDPVISDSLFHLIGEVGLVYPEWLEGRNTLDIELKWQGFEEHGWSVTSPFDAVDGRIRTDMQGFRHAVFLAGYIRVHDRPIPGGTLRVAITGDDWEFEDSVFADYVARIVSIEREFFHDYSEPFFLVTVVPTGQRVTPQSISMSGTGLVNSFALFLAPGTSVEPGSLHSRHVLHLLAHEYFHTWNGGVDAITLEEPEELTYWFSEGFTDFYASRLLHRAGLFSDQEWVDRLNSTIRTLWRSPVATEPATLIEEKYWSDRNVRDLPYDRGELVALMLNEEIVHTTDGSRTLDDFMRELLTDAQRGQKTSTESLLERIEQWTNQAFASEIRRIVVNGELPGPPSAISSPISLRIDQDIYDFEAGFDIDASIAGKVATGVVNGGPAYAAGLRDGQPLNGYSVRYGDPDHEIELTVVEDGESILVKYYPRGSSVKVPQYELE